MEDILIFGIFNIFFRFHPQTPKLFKFLCFTEFEAEINLTLIMPDNLTELIISNGELGNGLFMI